jgi:hypothetical protein
MKMLIQTVIAISLTAGMVGSAHAIAGVNALNALNAINANSLIDAASVKPSNGFGTYGLKLSGVILPN